jgi:hypothetical protein
MDPTPMSSNRQTLVQELQRLDLTTLEVVLVKKFHQAVLV